MKFRLILLVTVALFGFTAAHAQVEDPNAPPSEVPEAADAPPTDMPAPADAAPPTAAAANVGMPGGPKVAPPRPVRPPAPDTIKGNARNAVSFVALASGCGSELKGLAITNKDASRIMKVRVDVKVVFNGRMSQKSMLIDNLSPNEVRTVGCQGCIDKSTGMACTTYKIIAAAFK